MATTTSSRIETTEADQRVVLRGVGWDGYRTLLRLRGERSAPRMVYLDGDVYLMSPSIPHEFLNYRLGIFVTEVVTGLLIPYAPAGSTTFRRKLKEAGVEPDQSYYIANEARIRGQLMTGIHLRNDPPPDLAIEVVWTHEVDEAIETYRRFGVPEVWVCEDQDLRILVLGTDGQYGESDVSASFPFLKATEIAGWVHRRRDESELQWTLDVRRWVQETLLPRLGARET